MKTKIYKYCKYQKQIQAAGAENLHVVLHLLAVVFLPWWLAVLETTDTGENNRRLDKRQSVPSFNTVSGSLLWQSSSL